MNMKGKVGIRETYRSYREAVLDKIAETFPTFRHEYENQKHKI